MSDSERPEAQAFRELETLVRRLGDDLASYRTRALDAEARLRSMTAGGNVDAHELRDRITTLERENAELRGRLDAATSRTRSMLDRVHFLRQQLQSEQR